MYLVTAEEMRRLEEWAIHKAGLPGIVLMETAGRSVADEIARRFPKPGKAVIISGKGNNGGDGWVVARYLMQRNWNVSCWLIGNPDQITPDAKVFYQLLIRLNQPVKRFDTTHSGELAADLNGAAVIVDALLGTGVKGPLRPMYQEIVDQINRAQKWVVAVDLPTGVDTDGMYNEGNCVKADVTVTFQYPKWGHFSRQGKKMSGELIVKDIGLPPIPDRKLEPSAKINDPSWWKDAWPARDEWSHKGSHGHLLLVGGGKGMLGAICMAGEAAYRMGAGYVTLTVPESERHALAAKVTQELIWPWPGKEFFSVQSAGEFRQKANRFTSVAIGPGLGRFAGEDEWLKHLLTEIKVPLVLDADALNILAAYPELLSLCRKRKESTILTPHPGEMARLTSLSVAEVEANRRETARSFAEKTGMIVILKGRHTLIAHPDGTLHLNHSGSPALAKAGSGDLLTGMIGSLLAQKVSPFKAACMAVYLHGKAGEMTGVHACSVMYNNLLHGLQQTIDQEFVE
ncbi:NAD(P)H-hydrate dehydratase [Thermoactinomyces mirandus]|uniref:Bifunctional NAD(P)H-hydrate repair enzyme n=1 Tax=Thermoactinomyces mirandus TaxID=2756294 RepID=A0A7W1XUA3_9BACL|nr:NAD(P)H-hydrate dehydratase [Thermoactinomyces mirandus]MBA4603345.1 NAD(P)H-hydrate dehydratase [Thermoactinomyces mirandus]